MKNLKLRALVITALALGTCQASFAFYYSGCRWPCDPPTPRNGWKPADAAKALPQTAGVQATSRQGSGEAPSSRNSAQPGALPAPTSEAVKARQHK